MQDTVQEAAQETEARRLVQVIGIQSGMWLGPINDFQTKWHPQIPAVLDGEYRTEGQVAFLVADASAGSLIAPNTYVVCVPYDAERDRAYRALIVCQRVNAINKVPCVETSLWRVGPGPAGFQLEPMRENRTVKTMTEKDEAIPREPTHRVIAAYRPF